MATVTQAVFQARGSRAEGSTDNYVYTELSIYADKLNPVAVAVLEYRIVYRLAATPPNLPSASASTPTGWSLQSDLMATVTQAVFQARGSRAEGSTDNYVYTELSIYADKLNPVAVAVLEYRIVYRLAATPPNLPSASASTPTGWSLQSDLMATVTQAVFQARGSRAEGSTDNYVYTELSIYADKLNPVAVAVLEYRIVYQLAATPPNLPSASASTPTGWSLQSDLMATVTQAVFQARRPAATEGSTGNYTYTQLSIYADKLNPVRVPQRLPQVCYYLAAESSVSGDDAADLPTLVNSDLNKVDEAYIPSGCSDSVPTPTAAKPNAWLLKRYWSSTLGSATAWAYSGITARFNPVPRAGRASRLPAAHRLHHRPGAGADLPGCHQRQRRALGLV